MPSTNELIKAEALRLGFEACGIARPNAISRSGERLGEFLSAGYQGDMEWLAAKADWRQSPAALWPDARSVIMLGMNYGPATDPLNILNHPDRAGISVYARGRDYHDLVKGRLKQLGGWLHHKFGCDIKVFVDTAPVMEKPLAHQAGIGWQGKHTNLVSRDYGSWLFLGSVFTTLELDPSPPAKDNCGACHRCLDACPTNAFASAYRLDARRCISYLTIEHKGQIPKEFRTVMGNRIYGCDDCLAVCPWNKFAATAAEAAFHARAELNAPRIADLLTLNDADFREIFSGSPIKRIGRNRFVRNVLIAAGNADDPGLALVIQPLLCDDSALVRGMAVWAMSRLLNGAEFAALKAKFLPLETDGDVRDEWATAVR